MTAPPEIPEEPENLSGRPASWAFVFVVLAIAASVFVVWALQAFQLFGGGESPVQRIELLPVAQPFSSPTAAERARTETTADLDRWTWADRTVGRVRMPVGVAIDRYLSSRGAR